jgi:hypothetical protein
VVWHRVFLAILFWGGGLVWANHGSGPYTVLDDGVRAGWYNWSGGCLGNNAYIPMVHGTSTPAEIAGLMHSSCNDGRPLLIFNEPERADQDNTSPEDAVEVLHQVVEGGWRGQLYVGNVNLEQMEWLDQLVTIYSDRYGGYYASRYVPVQWGVHLYVNFQLPGWSLTADNLQDAALQAAVDRQAVLLDQFIARRQREGNSTRFAVSEMGGLGRWGAGDNPTLISQRMASLMRIYDTMLRARQAAGADAWFWYSSYSGSAGTAWYWPYGNLIDEFGQVTPVGEEWQRLAARN